MKTTRTIVAAAALAALLAACGTSGGEVAAPPPAPAEAAAEAPTTTRATTTTTEAPTTTTSPPLDPESVYLDLAAEHSDFLASQPESLLVEWAEAICGGFDEGLSAVDIASAILDGELPADQQSDMSWLAGAATQAYCPEHAWQWGS